MMLWDQTKQLPRPLLQQVENIYTAHFPLEVRLHLAAWIEDKCSPNKPPLNLDTADGQNAAVEIANELMAQLESKISSMTNDSDKYILKNKLNDIATDIRVRLLSMRFIHRMT